jgi:hypothetical protein
VRNTFREQRVLPSALRLLVQETLAQHLGSTPEHGHGTQAIDIA